VLVSVIAPCYNQQNTIGLLLCSLERQTLNKDDFEVIVADDGSTDRSPEILRNYCGPLRLVPVFSKENIGRARIRNMAVQQAKGEFLVFLDGDMTASPKLLEEHLQNQRNGFNLVCLGKMVPAPPSGKDCLSWYRVSRGAQKVRAGKPLPGKYFATGNSSLPAGLLKQAGPFNESYRNWGGEDIEMGCRLAGAGAKFVFLPAAVSHHHHLETIDAYIGKLREYAESGLRLLIRNCPEFSNTGYLGFFRSGNVFSRTCLNLLFCSPLYAVSSLLAPAVKFRPLAFRLYDYITYYHIFLTLKERPHD
jgi:glycosyltransferase involved in cell wall biosynthesis